MKITFIGAGNMGGAIIRGLLACGEFQAPDITIAKFAPSKPETIFQNYGCRLVTKPQEACKEADMIVVAVKPWQVEHVLHQIKPYYDGAIIVSIAGGVSLETLSNHISTAIFRVIPNIAAAVRESISFISSANASQTQKQTVQKIFTVVGAVMEIGEDKMEAATALGSCGVAFAMRYVAASMQAAIEMGLTPSMARDIVCQTIKGSAQLIQERDAHPAVLIDEVTTPGGITIKGLNKMESEGFSNSVIEGLKAARR